MLSVDKKWVAGDQSAPSLFVWFVVKKSFLDTVELKCALQGDHDTLHLQLFEGQKK